MRNKQLYQRILGIKSPWRVEAVEVSVESGEVKVHVQAKASTRHRCPRCGKRCGGYDHRSRRWRHWDTCQLKTIKTHLWGILNAIVLKANNGGAESINGRIKLIKVRSRGFRNKARFRNAIYFYLGSLDLYPNAVRS